MAVSSFHDRLDFQGFGADYYVRDANVVYEAHPYYDHGTTDAARDANFGFLRSIFPVYAGEWGMPLQPGPWTGRGFRQRLEWAAPLRAQARVAAYTKLDDDLARYAPFAVYGSFQYGEYFGARVGCKRFPPFMQGVDLGSLCVKNA